MLNFKEVLKITDKLLKKIYLSNNQISFSTNKKI